MSDFQAQVHKFSEKAERAAAQSRETLALLDNKGVFKGGNGDVQVYGSQALMSKKDNVLASWLKSVKGTVHEPTLFGNDTATPARYSELFDALVSTLASTADPPNDAELISYCTRLMPRDAKHCTDNMMRHTVQAMLLFEEAASNVLQQVMDETQAGEFKMELEASISRVLLRAEDCIKRARKRANFSAEGAAGLYMTLADARAHFGEARETLLESLDNVRQMIPKACSFQGADDIEAVKKMITASEELEQMAERIRCLSSASSSTGVNIDRATRESKKHDTRLALVSLLRQKHDELSDRWVAAISQRISGYRAGGSSTSSTPTATVSSDINKRLVAAMIERLRPGGDSASLVYSAQKLVEMRFQTMKIESVQAATKLFEDVAMEIYHEVAEKGPYSKDLLPLVHADDADVRSMLTEVVFLANKLIISEYNIRMARDQDPRLPSRLLVREGLSPTNDEVRSRIRELLMGAEIAGQYRLDTYIMAGGFGHGWGATDLQTGKVVFVKTFKSQEEFGQGADTVVAKMVEELETAERIMKVQRLMKHRNVVSVLKVPRNAMIKVPSTGQQGACFHGIITEYCDGGELFNYIVIPKESGGLQGCAFNEKQARFLFRQIIDLLLALHYPPEGEPAYYHGDIKDQNFVVSGSTLKLIDYGTLSKVQDNVGPAKHMTRSHQQPFHNNCESVDLWAAGIILLDMLLISSVGQMFKVSMGMNRGVTELKHGKFWDKIHMKLMQTDTNNCLLQNRPDSAQDLLRKIFVMEPRNSLNVKEIASHPWLKGPVPSDEEMASELKRRFKGILQGAPRGTAFFDLGKTSEKDGQLIMEQCIDLACAASKGEFVKAGVGSKPGSVGIHRWDRPNQDYDTGLERMHNEDGQWVVAKYLCNVEKSAFDLSKGRHVVRIRLFWESGSQHEDFCRLSTLLLNEVMKLHLAA
jgi:serine/threonine protein kinase